MSATLRDTANPRIIGSAFPAPQILPNHNNEIFLKIRERKSRVCFSPLVSGMGRGERIVTLSHPALFPEIQI